MYIQFSNSAITDETLLLLLAVQRDYESGTPTSACRPRIVSPVVGIADPVQVNRQATLLRLISTIEAYVDALINDLLKEQINSPVSLRNVILQEVELSSSRNWNAREKALKRIFGIRLSRQNSWKELEAAREARNSIAHGLGRLTAQQLQNRGLANKLNQIKIHIGNGRIVVTRESLSIVFQACFSFVKSLDAATQPVRK